MWKWRPAGGRKGAIKFTSNVPKPQLHTISWGTLARAMLRDPFKSPALASPKHCDGPRASPFLRMLPLLPMLPLLEERPLDGDKMEGREGRDNTSDMPTPGTS